ncbi:MULTISPECIES: hypothetical protein [Methylomonas]|uniref:hypothetical protein n=1 Tax=Methylomonas TaxID=416 RepID=UPI0012329045|nr:hypothetical protein [Methylomonas rhizoryzae]
MKPTDNGAHGPKQLNLVNSSRLQQLVKRPDAEPSGDHPAACAPKPGVKADPNQRLRQLADQRLAQILAELPAGRQHSLFKIRYGFSVEEFERLPPEQMAKILKLIPGKR